MTKRISLLKAATAKRIIICCGSGGVGKTTTAAAVALEMARLGRKAIVLTIDPAKRLATALGLESLGDAPKRIHLPPPSGPRDPAGFLDAMMLDTKTTFDRLIERHVKEPERRASILQNRLYQLMSSMIAGSQEYMATEKLYELYQDGRYDVLVLDTPPTRHALDFLEAPRKMINMTSNSVLEWFLKPGLFAEAGIIGLGVLKKGAEKILSVFDRIAGFTFLRELSEMLSLFSDLLGGFRQRAQSVYDLLHRDFVGFLLVTSPASVSVQDALFFHRKIDDANLPFLGFVVNRVHAEDAWTPSDLPTDFSTTLREKALDQLRKYEQLAKRDQKAVAFLKKMGGKGTPCATIPLFEKDVHDLKGLLRMAQALAGDT